MAHPHDKQRVPQLRVEDRNDNTSKCGSMTDPNRQTSSIDGQRMRSARGQSARNFGRRRAATILLGLLLAVQARAGFKDDFNGPMIAPGWVSQTGDGNARMTLQQSSGHGRIEVDARNDRRNISGRYPTPDNPGDRRKPGRNGQSRAARRSQGANEYGPSQDQPACESQPYDRLSFAPAGVRPCGQWTMAGIEHDHAGLRCAGG